VPPGVAAPDPAGRDYASVRRIRLVGRYVAFESRPCGSGGCAEAIVRVDLARARSRALSEPEPENTSPALDLELTSRGTVVWIRRYVLHDRREEVVRWDGEEAVVLATAAPDVIARNSLAVSGGRAYWTEGASPRSATLVP
jgi:hypothetical protein